MKRRKYSDVYGYSADEFDHWLEEATNKTLKCALKNDVSKSSRDAVFSAYEDGLRKASRRRIRGTGAAR